MSFAIAVSGKGGTGKTTLAALLIKSLISQEKKPVLAVDADANANLNDVLGVEAPNTIGSIRENLLAGVKEIPASMSKAEILDLKIQSSIIEASGYDLLVMGRPEGPGCYCYANNLIREIIESLSNNYPFIIVDNEAGMEHLSRRTTQKIDVLLLVANPTKRSLMAAKRIFDLVSELELKVDAKKLIINRVNGEISPELREYIKILDLEVALEIPEDSVMADLDSRGIPVFSVDSASIAFQAVNKFISEIS